jgi:NADH:ubiquinone oxidoreductase subunit 2 (subunit N)
MNFVPAVYFNSNIFFFEYGISLILLNITIYIILLFILFGVLFLFDIKFFKTLNEFKGFGSLIFLSVTVLVALLAMAGIPPMLGFVGKFLMFIYFMFKQNYLIAIFFTFFNFFVIYFYIQNIKFMVTKSSTSFFIVKNNFIYFNYNFIYFIVLLNFFNFFGIFFCEDILFFFSFVSSLLYLG